MPGKQRIYFLADGHVFYAAIANILVSTPRPEPYIESTANFSFALSDHFQIGEALMASM